MGTTFVTISRDVHPDDRGFWMRDERLELWLRLLALHLPDPNNEGEYRATTKIRDQWLLASRGYFGGHVPHRMEEACETAEGREVIRLAINSFMSALDRGVAVLDADTLNLLGVEREFASVDRRALKDIGYAFLDLMDDRITATAASTEIVPGSKPYKRAK